MTFSFLLPLVVSLSLASLPGWRCPPKCVCGQNEQVNCSRRELHSVPRILGPRVRVLQLGHNHIDSLPPGAFASVPWLYSLELQDNGLQTVHVQAFWGLRDLRILDLSANALRVLEPGTFQPLRALHILSLAGNRLMQLEPTWLGSLPLLQNLSLQDNLLPNVGSGVLDGLPSLRELNLHGNPWVCDCNIHSLCRWLRSHTRQAPGTESLLCVTPDRMTLRPMAALTDASFNYCAHSMTPQDLVVISVLGPLSFLASLVGCLILGSLLTVFRARRRNCRNCCDCVARCRVKRPIPQALVLYDPSENPVTSLPAPSCSL